MRVLSGIQPSGDLHLGNYLGSIKPNIELIGADGAEENIYFIADLHALTTVHDPAELRRHRRNALLDLLACGLDPERATLFFQSDVPQHTELAWVLSCVTSVGLLERAVSYKDKVAKGLDASHGLLSYPVLMAADILLYDADVVPVGRDQTQHLEIARDIAVRLNHRYGEGTLVLPAAKVREEVALVPGIDGQKMSKSYGNALPLFGDPAALKKTIMGIVTDSLGVAEPKNPDTCNVYRIHATLLDADGRRALADEYRAGGLGYGDAKKRLLAAYMDYFAPMRERRRELEAHEDRALAVVEQGAKRARAIAERTLDRVYRAVGIR
jgi:tryptophanyl-tRNA synthetase